MEIDKNIRLIDLTAGQFVELMTSTIKENEKTVIKELPKFITVPQLAELTGYSVSTIHQKNCKKEIPGCKKRDGRVLFDTEIILKWIDIDSVSKPTRDEQFVLLEKNFSKRKVKSINN